MSKASDLHQQKQEGANVSEAIECLEDALQVEDWSEVHKLIRCALHALGA